MCVCVYSHSSSVFSPDKVRCQVPSKFKKLAGKKDHVLVSDLKPVIGDIPIYEEVCRTFADDGVVNFRDMLDIVVQMNDP